MDATAGRDRFAAEARAPEPDAALLCLLVGAEADPSFDGGALEAARAHLARLAAEVAAAAGSAAGPQGALGGSAPAGGGPAPQEWARALREVLGGRHGFHGEPRDYERLSSSLLHCVLRRGRGLPILLSVVWTEVGRRAGAPVHGVGLPGHFVVGVGDPAGEYLLVDPFRGGRPLTMADAAALVAGATGEALSARMLRPAGALETVARVLNNVRAWAASRPEQAGVQLWAVELSLLLPHHPARLRLDRARLLVERGDFAAGADALESCAEVLAAMDPAAAESARRQARSARARLN